MKVLDTFGPAILLVIAVVEANFAHPVFKAFDQSKLDNTSIFEQFNGNSLEELGWNVSKALKFGTIQYSGEWALEEASVYPGFKFDKGLVVKTPSARHAISHKLGKDFNNTDNDLVLQYEVKWQEGLSCGGSYIKLLDKNFEEKGEFNYETPYQIMFGPDKCGANNKIKLIINRRNPHSKLTEEKHLKVSSGAPDNKISNLYTLIIKKDQNFEIRINGEIVRYGNLVEDPALLDPPLDPVQEIYDMKDSKPLSWDDRQFIADPNAVKPADYDAKHRVLKVLDLSATKPDDWDETEPLFILDPNAKKPDDWNDEENGEWEAPRIHNPKCEHHGCGLWRPPMKPNQDYKGPWVPPKIRNPNYRGEWQPRLISNPDYFQDLKPSNLELIGGMGFELWSVESGILFDNIYLGHSIEEAEHIGNTTFLPKMELEYTAFELNKPKSAIDPEIPPPSFDELIDQDSNSSIDVLIRFLRERLTVYFDFFDNFDVYAIAAISNHYEVIADQYYEFCGDPIGVISANPLRFSGYCLTFLLSFTFIFGIINTFVLWISGNSGVKKYKAKQEKVAQDNSEKDDAEQDDDEILDIKKETVTSTRNTRSRSKQSGK